MKKTRLTVLLLLITSSLTFSQNVGIGTENPDASALLDLNPPNSNKGLLIPRLTEQERNDIPNPAESLLIFNTDSQCYESYSEVKDKWFSIGCLKICESEFIDSRDGNTYKIAEIGNQCWMAENLKFLPNVDNTMSTTAPRYYVYEYSGTDVAIAKAEDNYKTYGVLYNWPAVMQTATSSTANPSGVQGICPAGWHVPSDEEWKQMEIYLGMTPSDADIMGGRSSGSVGIKLKTNTWGGGDNSSGFTALPGGYRNQTDMFFGVGTAGYWWSASESSTNTFFHRILTGIVGVHRDERIGQCGFSLRCVQD